MTNKELTEAVGMLLEREEARAAEESRRRREERRRRREEVEADIKELGRSVNVIKWCVVTTTAILLAAVVAVGIIAMEVEREAERIKGKVQEIQREAELIRDKIRHPLETVGAGIGRKLEGKIGEAFGGTEE